VSVKRMATLRPSCSTCSSSTMQNTSVVSQHTI
jgi:hypothetical protein